jgi:hypothetical protein
MCRNITTLRGLEPEATSQEIEAAARQYVRKVSGVQTLSPRTEAAFERAVGKVAEATTELLAGLPPRTQPPPTLPPLRRIAARSSLPAPGDGSSLPAPGDGSAGALPPPAGALPPPAAALPPPAAG